MTSEDISDALYSRLLVYRTEAYLVDMHEDAVTPAQIARYLGATVSMVTSVMNGKTSFDRDFFVRIAAQNKKKLNIFLADLVRWHRDWTQGENVGGDSDE